MATAHVNAKHKVFVLPAEPGIARVVPGTKEVAGPAGPVVVVPYTRDAVRFARNLGHRVPAPISGLYGWGGGTPWAAQKVTAALMTMHDRAYILNEIGTGKTRSALYAIDWLIQSGEIEAALIAAPLSTLARVWDAESFRYFPHLTTTILHGSRAERRKRLKAGAHLYIINHDGIETILSELKAEKRIGAVVIDELSYYRNSQTDRWKSMATLLEGRKFAWGMTGSPTPDDPTDAYGQIKLLTPARVPKYYKHFQEATMRRITQFKWVPKEDALDTVHAAMQPAVRFLRKDVAELPETVYQTTEVPLSDEQKKVHDGLVAHARHTFQAGEVTAINEGVLLSKLLQVASGYVYTTTRAVVPLDNHARCEALSEVLDSAEGKVIVFVTFIHAANALFEKLKQDRRSVELVTGDTSLSERNRIFRDFQETPSPRVLVAHPGCMSHGLTLTAANTVVWFTPTTSLETYEQANGRVTRPGQKRKTLIVHLCGTKIETKLYARLRQKAKTQGTLLEMFEQELA